MFSRQWELLKGADFAKTAKKNIYTYRMNLEN